MKLTKTESFVHKNRKQMVSLQVKFRYTSENSLCSKIAIHSKNFAIVAKFRYNSKIEPVSPTCSCFLLDQLLLFWLDAIKDKSYELDINQLSFDMLSLI